MADAKITQLTELTTADGADLTVVVDDVAGTPTTKKITLTNIAAWLASLTQTLTNKTLTSPRVGTAITDTNGNEIIKTPATASAVNEVTITNSATGNAVAIESTGGDTNIHLKLDAKGSAFTKVKVLRQNITTNGYEGNTVVLTGWNYNVQNSGGSAVTEKVVTFGITFSSAPIVLATPCGIKYTTAPTLISDLTTSVSGDGILNIFAIDTITTTTFDANASSTGNAGANTYRGFSWIAIGQLN